MVKMGNSLAEENVPSLAKMFSQVYNAMEGSEPSLKYSERHNINSAAILTVIDDETAHLIVESIADRIAGKTVVEIGGGIGLLSLHMGHVAKRVYCIEANPMWSWSFAKREAFMGRKADDIIAAESWRGFVYPAIEIHRGLPMRQSLARKLEERAHCCLRVGASA